MRKKSAVARIQRNSLVPWPFKMATDPFVGMISYLRIYSGTLKEGQRVFNPHKKKRERVQKILQMHADKRQELKMAMAGDIVGR